MIDVLQLVKDGKGRFEWHYVASEHGGNKLHIAVMRDAMKFDNMPALDWHRNPVGDGENPVVYYGVRLPATPTELQQIADMLGAMLLTPRVIDLIWLQAGLKFDANTNSGSPDWTIVAEMNVTDISAVIDNDVESLGGDDGTKLISCVGKFWCLINGIGTDADKKMYGTDTACNYGWCGDNASGPGVTPGVKCWQRPGYKHDRDHIDPSQTIRLMYREALLVRADGTEEYVDLQDVAGDPELAPHIAFDGKLLTYLRQLNVPQEPQIGNVVLPPVTIEAEVDIGPKVGDVS